MTIEEKVLEILRRLPPEKQKEVLKFVESLHAGSDRVPQSMKPLLEEVMKKRAERTQAKESGDP
ncbi:MAG: hypothetical protein HY313_11160 [Acidobacteria bacterium]|nr:hypothetical protein [Acidobacteriota bacterium]